ncbi:TonB-dependent receptor plug domain-containing protein [Raineya sp.]
MLICVFQINLSVWAQQTDSLKQNQEIEQIVVTATRTERVIASLPLPTQIITAAAIQKTALSRLHEIIQEQTGLLTIPDFGGGEGVQMQGLDAAYTMILIDGQPLVGRRAGTLDLARISLHNIERIEIVKGASSSLYGSDALAGVINIITKKISTDSIFRTNGAVSYRIANFGTHDASFNLQLSKNKIGIDLFGNFFASKGYNLSNNDYLQTVEPFRNFTFQPKLQLNFTEKWKIIFNNRFYTQNQDYKAIIQQERMKGESNTKEWNLSWLIEQKVSSHWKINYDFYGTNFRFDEYLNNSQNHLFEQNFYNQWFWRPEIRSYWHFSGNTLTSGIGLTHENLKRTYFSQTATLKAYYVFAQYEWFLKDKWNFLIGFRYDAQQQYQSQFSPKLALNYRLLKDWFVKTSLGYGYKAPDLRQLYFDFLNSAVGYAVFGYNVAESKIQTLQKQGQILFMRDANFSEPLKPESSLNYNLGTYFEQKTWHIDLNFFYNQIRNLIDTRVVAQLTNGQNVFSYFNINRIFTSGFELNLSYRPYENLNISLGYQYLTAKDWGIVEKIRNGQVFARNPETLASFKLQPSDYFGLFNRSKHLLNFKINYQIPQWQTNILARLFYRSKFGILDSNANGILDNYDNFVKGYFWVNLSISKYFMNKLSFQAGANNLFNFTDAENITNIAGRQFFAKMQFHF